MTHSLETGSHENQRFDAATRRFGLAPYDDLKRICSEVRNGTCAYPIHHLELFVLEPVAKTRSVPARTRQAICFHLGFARICYAAGSTCPYSGTWSTYI